MNILRIGHWNSKCNSCGRDCDPHEKEHKTNLGYNAEIRAEPGCGVTYTHVTSDYIDDLSVNTVKKMRPDLTFIDPLEGIRKT